MRKRPQAHALEIEAQAKHRLADEYDAAQERGEVRRPNNEKTTSGAEAVSVSDLGLSHKDIHEARIIRDAEKADPGIGRPVDSAAAAGRGRGGSETYGSKGRTARVGPFAPNSVEKGKVEAIPVGDETSGRRSK